MGYLREKKWFFAAVLLGWILLLLPLPEGLSREGMIVLAMTLSATVLFITEPVPLPTVALLIILGEILLLGQDSTAVAKSLMNDSVLFIMGSLILAVSLVKQNLDKRLALFIVRITGKSTTRIALGISMVSGVLASFIGEHTVAAMMLPVAIVLIRLTEEKSGSMRNLAVLLLFSISYACALAGVGTPSGGARNVIMIGYWKSFYYEPSDATTHRYLIDYFTWMLYAYPLFLIQLPILHFLLKKTFPPETEELSSAVLHLTEQIENEGGLIGRHYAAIILFLIILVSWITLSGRLGMGTIAIGGAAAFLVAGLVHWRDINNGVNWGVILLYAAAISLGVQMKDSGAAQWVADSFLDLLPLGLNRGMGLLAAVMVLTTLMTNTMSNGAAVAVLGPIALNMAMTSGESPIAIGFVTALSSAFAYFTVIGTPASTIVHSSGYLKPKDFMKVGWKLALVSFVLLLAASKFYWPLLEG